MVEQHEHLLSVNTTSLRPDFQPGDVLLVKNGQNIAVIPSLGGLLNLLRQPLGLGLIIYLPAGLIIFAEARHLKHAYARSGYSARLEA